VGRIVPDGPLPSLVLRVALEAALKDSRFRPVTEQELADLEIEISLLTPTRRIVGPSEIVLGRDGVVLQRDGRSAVFLPQVATEQGWRREELLEHLCVKAGLPSACWTRGATLAIFQAEVFGEHPPS
jgi:AmmeMemoRadiSam system protein A